MALVYYGGEPSDVAQIGSRVVTGRPAVVWSSSAKTGRLTALAVVDTGDGSSIGSGVVNGVTYSTGVVYPDTDGVYAYSVDGGPGSTWLEVHGASQTLRMVGYSSDGYIVIGGGTGTAGPAGPGVATGGTTGQYLTKSSGVDYATGWTTLPHDLPVGGTAGQALVKSSGVDYAVNWSSALATDSLVVHKATTETITGDKTFSGVVNVPTPTVGTHAATKAYADGLVSAPADGSITNAKLADMATQTVKGRNTAGTGDPEDLSAATVTGMLSLFTSGAKGVVSASGGGTSNFLRADGSWAAPGGGGGGSTLVGADVYVYRDATNTIAIDTEGSVVSSLATSAANNVTVIQAAIDSLTGTYTPGGAGPTLGYGGGGTVLLSGELYEVSGTIIVKYGVNLWGSGAAFDRNGFTNLAHSHQGTLIAPTSGLSSMDVETGAGTTTRTPVLLVGYSTGGSGSQSTTNPHGVSIRDLAIDCRSKSTAQAVLIADTQFVDCVDLKIANVNGSGGVGIEVLSTNAPDDGAHGTFIRNCFIAYAETGVKADGSGSTDSLLTGCRILQCKNYSISVGAAGGGGGWQIQHCHFTTGSGDMTTGNEAHIYVSGAPTTITANYFDTTGGWTIYADSPLCTMTGNYIKSSNSRDAAIYLSGSGRKAVITGNSMQSSSSNKGMVQVSSTTGQDWRGVIANNVIGDGGGTSLVAAVVDSGGSAISESNAAAVVARNGAANPYIWGNRFVQSAV